MANGVESNFPVLKKSTEVSVDSFKFSWLTLADALRTASTDYDEHEVTLIKELLSPYSADSMADATVL
jgi:hypothetical protein